MADCKAGAGRHKGTAYVGDASKQASSQAGEQATQPLEEAGKGSTRANFARSLLEDLATVWRPALAVAGAGGTSLAVPEPLEEAAAGGTSLAVPEPAWRNRG